MKTKWKWVVGAGLLIVAILVGLCLTIYRYPVDWIGWRLGLGLEPVVDGPQIQLAGRMTEPPRYWIFQVQEGQSEEVEYHKGALISILPSSKEGVVEIYSTAPFNEIAFPWEEWENLPQAALRVEFWKEGRWREGRSWTTGRVPAGPPEERGYRLIWSCEEWGEEDQKSLPGHGGQRGYAARLTVSQDLPLTELHTTFRSCLPEWDADHPRWKVLWVERLDACSNKQISGWSGKMIQVWVLDQDGEPLQGVEVRFGTEPSFGVAYDRPDIGGMTSRFGLVEWNSFGVPTKYWIGMENDAEPLFTNIRTDLGNEYCQKDGHVSWTPGCWAGFYSYRAKVQLRGD